MRRRRSHDLALRHRAAILADANSGNRILIPYLRAAGVRRLDGLILTHEDKDHSGGSKTRAGSVLLTSDIEARDEQATARARAGAAAQRGPAGAASRQRRPRRQPAFVAAVGCPRGDHSGRLP
jgi:glyoxylase-like metal-dependent hydrolase (beta-lactamase superfamily II)